MDCLDTHEDDPLVEAQFAAWLEQAGQLPGERVYLVPELCADSKWIAFLLCVYPIQTEVDGNTFGPCLKASEWRSEQHDPALVEEYEFAMRLLRQREENREYTH